MDGSWGTVEWAVDSRGRMPARDFFLQLGDGDRAKVLALFNRLAQEGRINNKEKFKSLGERGAGLWEFKSFQVRLLGDFRPGGRFLVAHGVKKKKDNLNAADIGTALRVLEEDDACGGGEGGGS